MTELDTKLENNRTSGAEGLRPRQDELRAARANLLESISLKLTDFVTAIIANCEMAAGALDAEHPALAFLLSAKQAAYKAHEANARVRGVVKECREANR
jgi:hypothetical protein